VPGEYYHIFNRGNGKQQIFLDDFDYARFLFILLHFQSNVHIYNVGVSAAYYIKHSVFNVSAKTLEKIVQNRTVELVAFALMPNHFHIMVKELIENGVANFMQRTQNSCTKYFNVKYKHTGHLLQGPYKALHVETNEQLLHLSAYIHRNPREIAGWKNKEHKFPWSSCQDYTDKNRWGNLLQQNIITDQIPHGKEYKYFIDTSSAKLSQKELDNELMID